MKKVLIISSVLLLLIAALLASYAGWNAASPERTCARCHEISGRVDIWEKSTHREIACTECHGTALSEGIHSLKEKGRMVFLHNSKTRPEDVRISEDQRLKMMQSCKGCHQAEYAKWNSGGHAMNYSEVFLNPAHNKAETVYDDCLRCHGMFYDRGTVADIVEPLDTAGPWKLKDAHLAGRPSIPCFACHQVHQPGEPGKRQDLERPDGLHYSRTKQTLISFYYRRSNMYFPVPSLASTEITYRSVPVKVSTDPGQRLCLQCHSPNAFNMAGTSDDRTPRGVHEGIGCLACHDPHSNSSAASCKNCHPAISNCKLDVEKMNTTYIDQSSRNNIHFVACTDCHMNGRPAKSTNLVIPAAPGTLRQSFRNDIIQHSGL
jgi:Zn-finger nucleic acid-binding protein